MLYVVIGILVIIIIYFIAVYNSFVKFKNMIEDNWAQIEVQLKKRYDLVTALVDTVKGYAKHEREIFENVTKAHTSSMQAQTMEEKQKAEGMIGQSLKSLFALAEAYPELKANDNFKELQNQLGEIEGKIAFARQLYNDTVVMYNTKRQTFPSNIVAGIFNFEKKSYFKLENEAEKNPVKINFD